ncbi:MAG TPA: HWE histidine kinase domain-containing protein [Terracidiphilus sp.]|nr:HWE histidine kinase domain-containing protein [Terracidiphilus sp.]
MNEIAVSPATRSEVASFLIGGGDMATLISAYDWSGTPLGALETWPQSLKTATAILLRSPVPIVMLWGEDGIMICNDAYSVFAAERHPRLLGCKVREGWPEVADFNDNVMKVGLAGGTLAYRDQELTLHRKSAPEQVWMNLDYSPVLDESGKPAGVIAIVVETTEKVLAQRRIAAERERLAQMFEKAPSFMALLRGPDHVFELINSAQAKLIGERDVLGKAVGRALPELEGQGLFELLDHVYRTGRAVAGKARRVLLQRTPDGPLEERFVDIVFQPITDLDRTVSGIFVEGADVTERTRAEAEVRRSEERFRALVNATSDVVYHMSPDWSEMRQLYGRDFIADTMEPSRTWLQKYIFPEDQDLVLKTIEDAIRAKNTFQLEHRVRRVDGSSGWTFSRAVPLLDKAGEITGWFGAASDITARKQGEEHLKLMVDELNHRVKNMLATVQSIAAQTFRGGTQEEARAAFEARLFALSHAHQLLTREHWEGVDLSDLALQILEPFKSRSGEADRFSVSGTDIRLKPKLALSLGMAFHELAGNAAKYGALSNSAGRVSLAWQRRPEDRLRLVWRERDGPRVHRPTRRGFGSRLIERGLANDLGGTVRLDYDPRGVVCVIEMPIPRW